MFDGAPLYLKSRERGGPDELNSSCTAICEDVTRPTTPVVMNPITKWYMKLAGVGLGIGASMELFMIHTGFYEKVVALEAQQRAEAAREILEAENEVLEAGNGVSEAKNDGASGTDVKAAKMT